MTAILLIDDHEIIRDAIKTYFAESEEFVVTGEASNGKEGLELLEKNSYDLVITDINMPVMTGLEFIKVVEKEYPKQKVLVLSMHGDSIQIKQMLEHGASGYVLKNVSREELFEAIREVLKGETYYSREVYNALIRTITKRKPTQRLTVEVPLSDREKEILVLITHELSNKEIADKLFISSRTVETHKRNLLEKTGCKNVAGLVMYAVERELV